MNVGDRVRIAPKPACEILGLPFGDIGVVRIVDATCERTAVLVSFPDSAVYTSALSDDDVEIVSSDVTSGKTTSQADG